MCFLLFCEDCFSSLVYYIYFWVNKLFFCYKIMNYLTYIFKLYLKAWSISTRQLLFLSQLFSYIFMLYSMVLSVCMLCYMSTTLSLSIILFWLIDIVLYLCEKEHVEGGMIFQLLEDLTEMSTMRNSKDVFGYIESKQDILGKVCQFSSLRCSFTFGAFQFFHYPFMI